MNRKLLYSILGILVFLTTLFFWYTNPKELNKTFDGVFYQLGSENFGTEEILQIKVKGEVQRNLFGNKTFIGIIDIDGEVIPPPEARYDEVEFKIGSGYGNFGSISYIDDERDSIFTFGNIYVTDDFNAFTIAIITNSESGGTWNSGDGMVISAQATNRKEALNIANELVNHPSLNPFE